jgi:hypothetical protein
MKPGSRILNLLAYQCAWLACVLGAANQLPLVAIGVAAGVVLLHFAVAAVPERELALVTLSVLAGVMFESALVASGWVRSNDPLLLAGTTPALMVVLWAAFATTLNVALRPLRQRPLLCAALAAIGAPLAYQAGSELGALVLVDALPALALVSAGWAVLLPLLMRAAQRLDGFAPA